jgi:hypothetical protein
MNGTKLRALTTGERRKLMAEGIYLLNIGASELEKALMLVCDVFYTPEEQENMSITDQSNILTKVIDLTFNAEKEELKN